jgi:outer membrane immunogenic protein
MNLICEVEMKKVALSVAALALAAGSALAADLPSRKGPPVLPPPPPPPMWTGFYVGLNAGGTWANSNNVTTTAIGLPGTDWATFAPLALWGNGLEPALSASGVFGRGNNGGFIGGGQVGYNWQFYNNFVAGIEADIQGIAGSSGSRTFFSAAPAGGIVGAANGANFVTASEHRSNLDYIGTVRGRLGWLFTPTLLLYGTGGLAYGGVSVNNSFVTTASSAVAPIYAGAASLASSTFADTRVGWTAGGGLEWMFWPNWSAKVEYLYYDLGSVTTTAFAVAPPSAVSFSGGVLNSWANAIQTTQRFNGNIVRAGVNYHFNWGAPAPVVAKY